MAARHTISRQAKHGTQFRYSIRYVPEPGGPSYYWHTWAYNMEHAIENWHDTNEGEFEPRAIARQSTRPAKKWIWHAFDSTGDEY